MEKIKEKIISIFIFLASIVLSFWVGKKEFIGNYIMVPFLIVVLVVLSFIVIYQRIEMNKYVRYSVMIFVLNEESELLLVLSQMFGKLIIPSGMLKKNELPHLAVERILQEEVGLEENAYIFDSRYHRKLHRYARVQDCYAPFAVQQEFITKHQHGVKYHYTYFYVCNLKDGAQIKGETKYFPQFFSLDEIKNMDNDTRPFQDLIQRYEHLLNNDI